MIQPRLMSVSWHHASTEHVLLIYVASTVCWRAERFRRLSAAWDSRCRIGFGWRYSNSFATTCLVPKASAIKNIRLPVTLRLSSPTIINVDRWLQGKSAGTTRPQVRVHPSLMIGLLLPSLFVVHELNLKHQGLLLHQSNQHNSRLCVRANCLVPCRFQPHHHDCHDCRLSSSHS